MQTKIGFREHAHTADWELEVWAPDFPRLLEQAARGMYVLSGVELDTKSPEKRSLTLQAIDKEGLLVQFLTELLWLQQDSGLGFDHISIKIDENLKLWADLSGGSIHSLDKEIKAVTYHNLKVDTTPDGLRVNIVFDV